jgi:hypothetical protein
VSVVVVIVQLTNPTTETFSLFVTGEYRIWKKISVERITLQKATGDGTAEIRCRPPAYRENDGLKTSRPDINRHLSN